MSFMIENLLRKNDEKSSKREDKVLPQSNNEDLGFYRKENFEEVT